MTVTEPTVRPVKDEGAQALFEEARRRRRRRWLLVLIVLVAAGAVLLLLRAASGGTSKVGMPPRHSSGPGLPAVGSPGHDVVVIDNDAIMTMVDFSTGARKTVTLANKGGGDYPDTVLATGGFFVYPGGGGGTWVVPLDLSVPARLLGPSTDVIPSVTPGRVWLVTISASSARAAAIAVQEVGANGRYRGSVYHVPPGFSPISGVVGGLVLVDTIGPQGGGVVWGPATGRFGTRFPGPNVGNLVDVRGSKVAWGAGCSADSICTSLRVTDVRTGRSRDYPSPPGTFGWVSTGGEGSRDAYSSGGHYLAVRAAHGAGELSASDVYVVNMTSGATSLVPDSTATSPYSRVAWLPNTLWVISASSTGSLSAYNVHDGKLRSFATPCCGVALLSVVSK